MNTAKQITQCYHCGERCDDGPLRHDQHNFCCHGCKSVYVLLHETGLVSYYDIEEGSPGTTVGNEASSRTFLDLDEVQDKLIDFREGNRSKVTFYLPTIHCAACIWLLERLDRVNDGVIQSEVNFLRRELTVHFQHERISLRELVMMLERLGYSPDLQRDEVKKEGREKQRSLLVKMGVAGFAFGNIMLFSFPDYLSLDDASLESFGNLFGYLNLLLALPVLLYADLDYLKSAWQSVRLRYLTIDVPIALGIVTLFLRSAFEVISGVGGGYFDSFAGLIFFLLVGKWYQGRTYESLAFDRDFKSYFPMAVSRIDQGAEEVCMLEDIKVGDRLRILHQQIIPADAILIKGEALIDYSFVSGESDTVRKQEGSLLYAGGRQSGGAIEIEVVKEFSQGYLTGLWNSNAFQSDSSGPSFTHLIDKVSRSFSIGILLIAVMTLAYWLWFSPAIAIDAFSAVLIIACPCALALSMPFTSGNVTRILGGLGFFVKNAQSLEQMAHVDVAVFDKTGTLTKTKPSTISYHGEMLGVEQLSLVRSALANSTHPLSVAIRKAIEAEIVPCDHYEEMPGLGMRAKVLGHDIMVGSRDKKTESKEMLAMNASLVHLSIDGVYFGCFAVEKELRSGIEEMVKRLQQSVTAYLVSGDQDGERRRMENLFGQSAELRFRQTPLEKLEMIEQLQSEGKKVMMLGDGLNDAGALKQADVGIAVADDVFSFSPACDAILQAERLKDLSTFIDYIRKSMFIVKASILISLLYNIVGLYFAVRGELTPLVAAILMPLSSVSVVGFVSVLSYLTRPKLTGYN